MIYVWQMNDGRWHVSAKTNAHLDVWPPVARFVRKHADCGFESEAEAMVAYRAILDDFAAWKAAKAAAAGWSRIPVVYALRDGNAHEFFTAFDKEAAEDAEFAAWTDRRFGPVGDVAIAVCREG